MDVYSALIQALRERFPGMELREREPMERHTSFRIGGPARLMALPRSEEEAAGVVQAARAHGIEPFFMGNGSNLLVSDAGYEGVILKTFDGMDCLSAEEDVIRAGSGVLLSRLAHFALEHGLTGLEFAHGIPGTVGGALLMNAGAYGGEMCQVAEETRVLTPEGTVRAVRGGGAGLLLPAQRLLRRRAPDPGRDLPPGTGRAQRDPRQDGGPLRPPPGEAAPGAPQRGQHLQAARGALCRRSHRALRPEGQARGGRPGVGEARGLCRQPGRGHLRRRDGPDRPHPGDRLPGDRRDAGDGGTHPGGSERVPRERGARDGICDHFRPVRSGERARRPLSSRIWDFTWWTTCPPRSSPSLPSCAWRDRASTGGWPW